jgi:hypothetical protein
LTIPGFLVINLFVGVSMAFASRIQIRTLQRPLFFSRYFSALMMLEFMILLPVAAYFYAFYPDWSWMYLVDTSSANAAIGVMTIIAYPIACLMGYMVGYYSARGNSDWVAVVFAIFIVAGLMGMIVVAEDKLLWVGTYEQYHRNAGLKPFISTSLFPSAVLSFLGAATCWFYLVYRFVQEGRLSLRAS